MIKKLTAIGNSLGIVIEKPILDLLKIDRDTEMEVTTDGVRLVFQPVRRSNRRAQVDSEIKKAFKAHDATFRKLAK